LAATLRAAIAGKGLAVTAEVLRRKMAKASAPGAAPGAADVRGGEKAWRIGLARALRDVADLPVDVTQGQQRRMSLAEVLDLPMERALILMLEGPQEGTGLLVLSAEVLASTVEKLTLGRCGSHPPDPRRPSRTDAAMIWPLADLALENLAEALEDQEDLVWADGFRAASFIEEPRPLALLLDDVTYRVLRLDLSLALGARQGTVLLVLPADGKGRRPAPAPLPPSVEDAAPAFAEALAARIDLAECRLEAVIGRLSMPLAEAMALQVGAMIPLMAGGLDAVSLEGMDGRRLAEGKLGQQRGMRAVRVMTAAPAARVPATPAPPRSVPAPQAAPAAPSGEAALLPATGTTG
jgi:flagellar motor switch protein FliM